MTLDQASKLADGFVLTHKRTFVGRHSPKRNLLPKAQHLKQASASVSKKPSDVSSERLCLYCKKCGRVDDCMVLKKKQAAAEPATFVKSVEKHQTAQPVEKLAGSSSFPTDSFVSLSSDTEVGTPIEIRWDSAAFQSVLLQDALPFTVETFLGSRALVKGFGERFLNPPLHNINLHCELVSGGALVALSDGVTLLLGNDLAF